MRRLILAVFVLTLTLPATATASRESRPATQGPSAQCMDDTARALAARSPGAPIVPPDCLPRSALTGKIATLASSSPAPRMVCPANECAIYIWGKKGIGYQDIWTYPVRTVDFYGFRCFEELNMPPQGQISTDAFGLFDNYGGGAMTHRPASWLQWCTQKGLVRSGAMVDCSGAPIYPYYFNNSSCNWSISPGFKPTRTVGMGWTFTGVAGKETVGLIATIVANTGGRDVLIKGWRWSL